MGTPTTHGHAARGPERGEERPLFPANSVPPKITTIPARKTTKSKASGRPLIDLSTCDWPTTVVAVVALPPHQPSAGQSEEDSREREANAHRDSLGELITVGLETVWHRLIALCLLIALCSLQDRVDAGIVVR
jgi:hypothetical protein